MTKEPGMNPSIRRLAMPLLLAALAACCALPASAGMRLGAWKGHLGVGYSVVFSDTLAPPGSMSASLGVEYPIATRWLLGPSVGFNLLGSSTVSRGSVTAALDYSHFDIALMATYLPARGPFTRLSFGSGVASNRAELAVAGGGALFRDLPVDEVKPEFAAEATLGSRKQKIVAIGAELGVRVIPVEQCTWTVFTARLGVYF
jgi:hypothetical protein